MSAEESPLAAKVRELNQTLRATAAAMRQIMSAELAAEADRVQRGILQHQKNRRRP